MKINRAIGFTRYFHIKGSLIQSREFVSSEEKNTVFACLVYHYPVRRCKEVLESFWKLSLLGWEKAYPLPVPALPWR